MIRSAGGLRQTEQTRWSVYDYGMCLSSVCCDMQLRIHSIRVSEGVTVTTESCGVIRKAVITGSCKVIRSAGGLKIPS